MVKNGCSLHTERYQHERAHKHTTNACELLVLACSLASSFCQVAFRYTLPSDERDNTREGSPLVLFFDTRKLYALFDKTSTPTPLPLTSRTHLPHTHLSVHACTLSVCWCLPVRYYAAVLAKRLVSVFLWYEKKIFLITTICHFSASLEL